MEYIDKKLYVTMAAKKLMDSGMRQDEAWNFIYSEAKNMKQYWDLFYNNKENVVDLCKKAEDAKEAFEKRAQEIANAATSTTSQLSQPGRDVFKSDYYYGYPFERKNGQPVYAAKLLFKEQRDYNRFLNWWCLGNENAEKAEIKGTEK